MKYQVSRDGRVIGDFLAEDIKHGLQEGSLVVTDYYWTDGMPAWLPLSELPKQLKGAPLAKFAKKAAIPLLLIAIVAGAMIGYDFNAKRIKAQEAEDLKAKLAKVSGRLMDIQSKLVQCELFLRDYELTDKGQPDDFDKTKPIYPGTYRNRSPRAKSEADAFNADWPNNHGRTPGFRLFAEVRGDGNVHTFVRTATTSARPRLGFGPFNTNCELSLDGVVQTIEYDYRNDNGDPRHFDIPSSSISKFVRLLREGKTPRIMMRVGSETADLEYDRRSLLECFDLSSVLQQREELLEEKTWLNKTFTELKNKLPADAEAGR
jgi:hypothetical protein